ncbi:shugoshin 1 isoform X2 [Notothenia coriiceps]|nr:PREDICTED: shugoshin-like 1 isoform X2 [Notothenia coriiceps]
MAKERAQKKSFQQSLEDIKEKMKEKRNKRLESASAPNRGRLKKINTNSVVQSASTLLLGVQQNNKMLAVALQAEKEKLGHANVMILQLKREQQALFLHLILLKRKLKEQEAAASETSTVAEPKYHVDSPGRKRSSQNLEKPSVFKASPIYTDPQPSERNAQSERQVTLPSTVVVRRGHADRSRRRRSERVQQNLSHIAGLDTLIASPIRSDVENTNQPQHEPEPDLADPVDTVEFQHSTPEPVPPKENNQQGRSRKRPKQTPSTKPEPAAQKPERGCKADRVPLKKPWDKPRTRSKSRDRSATRAKTGPLSQENKLNTSLGFNDTFDFDCEEAVHVTPFKAKAEDNQPSTPVGEETPQTEALPVVSKQDESSPFSSSSESEDSLYVPEKTRRREPSPDMSKKITTRRGRASEVTRRKKSVTLQQKIPVFRDEAAEPEMEEAPNSPHPAILRQDNNREPHPGVSEKDCLPSVSPLVKEEMKRINSVLSSFGDSSGEGVPLLPHKTLKTCKKRGLGVRTAGQGLSLCDVTNMSPAAHRSFSRNSEALCSTPVPARKRRYTSVVDYKEPTINTKLRRGDKFTDLQFLRSPIFKQKSRRTSVSKSRNSKNGQLRNAMGHLLN